MEKASNRTNCNKEDDSLGILSMENLKVFGETSVNASNASSNNQSRISDRLNQERHKAFETLKKFDNSSKSHKKQHYNNTASNKENHQQGGSTSVFDQTPSVTDQSQFVHYRRPTSINISDLVTDTSITLEKSIFAKPTPVATKQQRSEQQLSFEPAEITGRSTLNKLPKQQQQRKSKVVYADHVSVADILASSFAPKARDLSETLRSGGGHDSTMSSMMDAPAGVRRAFSTTSSSMMSYNGLHSLPRTADMSKMSQTSDLSLMGGDGFSFSSAAAAAGNDHSTFNDENFAPGEMMMNKLILDEIAWADEFAAIPAATLSKQARATAMKADIMTSNPFDSPRITNSMLADGNHSVGTFFNMRSENLWDMVKTKSPDKYRTPIALVDICTDDETTQSSFASSVHATSTRGGGSNSNAKTAAVDPEITPKPDNKTYTKLATPTPSQKSSIHKEQHSRCSSNKPLEKHESKDSGHDSQNSFLLSMSAIDRALCNLNIETDNSEAGVIQQVLNKAKQSKSPQLQQMPPPPPPPRNSDPKGRAGDCLSTIADILSENKENLNPEMLRNATLSDTMEFTESLLNSTDMKQAQRSSNNSALQRSPLSPLNLLHPHVQLTINGEGNEADEDEWPSTPVKGYNRRQRRTKSPRDGQNSPGEPDKSESENRSEKKTPMQNGDGGVCLRPLLHPDGQLIINGEGNEADEDEWNSTPPLLRRQRRNKSPRDGRNSPREPEKSESENRSEKKSPGGGGSLRHLQNSLPKSLCSTRIDGAATECDLGISPTISRNASPNITITAPTNGGGGGLSLRNHTLTNSSPIPYQTASPMSRSPMSSPSVSGGYRSPQLDSTTNSERRYLSAGGGGVAHKANSSPVPSDSGNSNYGVPPTRTYSCNSQRTTTANGRSISRCSNSSEFSHRDGKAIPLKVTQLQLSWGSTKLRTTANKTMQVKNIAHKRLVVRLMVQGPGFQLLNSMSNTLTLQSQECRSIVITFCPTVTGIAIGALCFYSPVGTTTMNTPFLEIPLYGYGGHAAIVPQNMQKGPVGAPFLPLGDVCELTQPLQRSFRIHNRGPLLGFAHVSIDSMGLMMPRLSDAFEVHPQCMLIPANKSVSVTVTFRPRREDIKKIVKKIQQVLTLANMRIICGDEANRQRMRHLASRMSAAERSKISSNTLDKLWHEFPGEVQLAKFEAFKEEPDIIMDLIACMRIQEIALTINRDGLDDTVQSTSMYYPDADDTVLFRTICAASPVPSMQHLEPVDEMLETSMRECNGSSEQNEDERAVSSSSRRDDSWSVHPSILEFDFRANSKQQSYGRVSLLIRNSYKSRQYFEVTCNRKQLLAMTPSEGYVAADGGQVLIEVRPINEEKLMHACAMQPDISILVHMENERITVPVKIYQ